MTSATLTDAIFWALVRLLFYGALICLGIVGLIFDIEISANESQAQSHKRTRRAMNRERKENEKVVLEAILRLRRRPAAIATERGPARQRSRLSNLTYSVSGWRADSQFEQAPG